MYIMMVGASFTCARSKVGIWVALEAKARQEPLFSNENLPSGTSRYVRSWYT